MPNRSRADRPHGWTGRHGSMCRTDDPCVTRGSRSGPEPRAAQRPAHLVGQAVTFARTAQKV